MSGNLQGKAAVVTGSGRGIGQEVALLMATEGASVVINDPGGRASANYNSVTHYEQAAEIVKQCVGSYGKLDCVVNVAGFLRERMVWNMSEDDWDAVITVQL